MSNNKNTKSIFLNKNENPYTPSVRVIKEIEKLTLNDIRTIKKEENENIILESFSSFFKMKKDNILVTSGNYYSIRYILNTFYNKYVNVILSNFEKEEYKNIFSKFNIGYYLLEHEKDFSLSINNKNINIQDENTILILSSPNENTGIQIEKKQIEEFLDVFSGTLVIDESYADFSSLNIINLINKYKNLIIIRNISHSHSLGYAKLGFILAHDETIKLIEKIKYNNEIDTITSIMAKATIEDIKSFFENRIKVIKERERLTTELTKLGFLVIPSNANFILVRHMQINYTESILNYLKSENIIVKSFFESNIEELKNYLRITIGTQKQNTLLLNKIKTFLKKIV